MGLGRNEGQYDTPDSMSGYKPPLKCAEKCGISDGAWVVAGSIFYTFTGVSNFTYTCVLIYPFAHLAGSSPGWAHARPTLPMLGAGLCPPLLPLAPTFVATSDRLREAQA